MVYYPDQPRTCGRCGKNGHKAMDCQELSCRICRVAGHETKDCPRSKSCSLCGAAAHLYRDCPQRTRSYAAALIQGRPPAVSNKTRDPGKTSGGKTSPVFSPPSSSSSLPSAPSSSSSTPPPSSSSTPPSSTPPASSSISAPPSASSSPPNPSDPTPAPISSASDPSPPPASADPTTAPTSPASDPTPPASDPTLPPPPASDPTPPPPPASDPTPTSSPTPPAPTSDPPPSPAPTSAELALANRKRKCQISPAVVSTTTKRLAIAQQDLAGAEEEMPEEGPGPTETSGEVVGAQQGEDPLACLQLEIMALSDIKPATEQDKGESAAPAEEPEDK